MEKKCIFAFVDGRPGHEKQTFGIIASLREHYAIDLHTIHVKKIGLWQTATNCLLLFLPFLHNQSATDVSGADLLIGTGSSTHLPMLLCKKKYKVPAVTCMSPNILLKSLFDLCFVPEHDGLQENHKIKLTLGAPNLAKNCGRHQDELGLIAVGGKDEKSHVWDSDSIVERVKTIVKKDRDISWTITSSPRTPPETAKGLQDLADQYNNCTFFDFAETRPGWIEEQYARSRYVWVTSDSISMIYEALSSGCRVGILPMRWKKREGKFQRNENILQNNKLIISYDEWLSGAMDWPVGQTLDESRKCVRLIQSLW